MCMKHRQIVAVLDSGRFGWLPHEAGQHLEGPSYGTSLWHLSKAERKLWILVEL